ncbi:unnamed protein product [Polarella glacialis]|uniref:Uncharacterized protein n=1 Tax=Polarella glacialis TaxID=89957 RepID=A0A813EK86_POLGL|nr:unnamed protein product [Polarella glacialis]
MALQKSFAWQFLLLLSEKPPILLGGTGPQVPRQRCYRDTLWGHEAVTLFGRDKGGLSTADARAALSGFALGAYSTQAFSSKWPPRPSGGKRPRRILLMERKPPARRALLNKAEVLQLLRGWDLRSRKRTSCSGRTGRCPRVELMPHMQVLNQQLCRSSAWDSTPMYAYGGLALLLGLRHICLVGLPPPDRPVPSPSLGLELGTWWSSDVYVDVQLLNRSLRAALSHLDESSH